MSFQFVADEAATTGRCLVLHPHIKSDATAAKRSPEARLEEAVGLAAAIQLDVIDAQVVYLNQPRPSTLFGTGKLDEIKAHIKAIDADLVIVDGTLTPVQQRNLEKAWKAKVIDRTGLILDIFGARARTREGRLQVELAALEYQRSRLVRSWTHLERQRGGLGFIGGPGESQLEIDRRLISERITKIKKALTQVSRTRGLHRKSRQKVPYPVVAFVGYTNAGKSTLFNRLTEAKVFAEDLLFATLDPTMRAITLPSGAQVILSDTVGFISELPHSLVAAFQATLEEVLEADIVVHVRDISHPDSEAQFDDVLAVLEELGIEEEDQDDILEVANKIDLMDAEDLAILRTQSQRNPNRVMVSAETGEGCDAFLALVEERLNELNVQEVVMVPYENGQLLAWLYENGDVLYRDDTEEGIRLSVSLSPTAYARLQKQLP